MNNTTSTCDTQIYDEIISSDNAYPCYKCRKIHKCEEKSNLIYAIKYLQLDRVKELLNSINSDELINYRYSYNASSGSFNILDITMYELVGWSGSDYPSTNLISMSDFSETGTLYLRKNQMVSVKLFVPILDFICSKVPQLITEEHIIRASYYRASPIVNILTNYYIEDADDDACFICF